MLVVDVVVLFRLKLKNMMLSLVRIIVMMVLILISDS